MSLNEHAGDGSATGEWQLGQSCPFVSAGKRLDAQRNEPEKDIPLSTLAKVENDKLSLNYEKLQHLSSRLGLSMSEFLSQADEKRTPAAAPVTALSKQMTARYQRA